jgi:hypothetical protein
MGKLVLGICAASSMVAAQSPSPPRFEDFPAARVVALARIQPMLELPGERMFRTRLIEAAEKPPNFAGTLRGVVWGCGSNCASGAFIDLKTGVVYPQPLTNNTDGLGRWAIPEGMFSGAGMWGRLDSRLLIIRCGKTWIEREDLLLPDTYYFAWEEGKFRLLSKVEADRTVLPKTAIRLN